MRNTLEGDKVAGGRVAGDLPERKTDAPDVVLEKAASTGGECYKLERQISLEGRTGDRWILNVYSMKAHPQNVFDKHLGCMNERTRG